MKSGAKSFYNSASGFPQVRTACIVRFANAGGFASLNILISSPDFMWPGCHAMFSVIKGMSSIEVNPKSHYLILFSLLLLTASILIF